MSGSKLVGRSSSTQPASTQVYQVPVWVLDTLAPLHTLRQPASAGQPVFNLASDGNEVRGAADSGREQSGGVG